MKKTEYVTRGDHLIESEKEEIAFGRFGKKIDNPKDRVYAKLITHQGRSTYYIKTHQNVPYDPLGPYGKREQYIETKMKKVSKNTFDFYMMYLSTNKSIYMTKTQRGFLND